MSPGEKLKYLRKRKNWSQQEAADRAEISRSYLSELEHDNSDPTLSMISKLANLYGVDRGFLIEEKAISLEQAASMNNIELPNDIIDFITESDKMPYIVMAKEFGEAGISVNFLKNIVSLTRNEINKKK